MLRPVLLLAGLGFVNAHGALISPMPRNAVDRFLPAYRGGRFGNGSCFFPAQAPPHSLARDSYGPPDGNGSCWGCNCVNGTQPCNVAQSCVWFTEGTSIGCDKPGGDSPSPSPHCKNPMNATNNSPYYRTVNLNATALGPDDKYRWNPWRAPGNAPIYDPCGMAGGAPVWRHTALSFYDTGESTSTRLWSLVVLPQSPPTHSLSMRTRALQQCMRSRVIWAARFSRRTRLVSCGRPGAPSRPSGTSVPITAVAVSTLLCPARPLPLVSPTASVLAMSLPAPWHSCRLRSVRHPAAVPFSELWFCKRCAQQTNTDSVRSRPR